MKNSYRVHEGQKNIIKGMMIRNGVVIYYRVFSVAEASKTTGLVPWPIGLLLVLH